MKDVGMIGLPEVDAGSVFTAITAVQVSAGKANQAVVAVPDERVDKLVELHSSKKSVYAQLRFVDTSASVRSGGRAGAGRLPAELLGLLRNSDSLLLIVNGSNATAELDELGLELLYSDMELLSNKATRDRKAAHTPEAKAALEILEKAVATLESGEPLSAVAWDSAEMEAFQGMAPLTLKPQIATAIVEDGSVAVPEDVTPIAAQLETEVAGLDAAEAQELLESFGIKERALPRIIRGVYDVLSLLTFLTAGEDESRAWEVPRGATAPQAAGAIHSDIERGFIRAEVVSYEDLVEAGSWSAAKTAGKVRQEGKTYVMNEGDVVDFRFAV